MTFIPGCSVCQVTIPDPVTVDHEDGTRTIHQTCQVCGYVWVNDEYTSGQALSFDQLAALERLLADLQLVTASRGGVEGFHAMEQEVELRYGPKTAAALRAFVEGVFEAERASRAVQAERHNRHT